jgi:positive regulator of sigma E activity
LSQDNNKKNITDGKSYFAVSDLFKGREGLYLLQIFGLSVLMFLFVSSILSTGDRTISYFLSLISSVLIIDGYSKVKKESKQ